MFPAEYGTLSTDDPRQAGEVALEMPLIGPNATESLTQTLTILPEVRGPLRLNVTLGLYISDPSHQALEDTLNAQTSPDLVLVQMLQISLRISDLYQYNPSSEILMIVNSQASPQRMLALRGFIQEELGMEADCWDIDLNGGLQSDVKGQTGKTPLRFECKSNQLCRA